MDNLLWSGTLPAWREAVSSQLSVSLAAAGTANQRGSCRTRATTPAAGKALRVINSSPAIQETTSLSCSSMGCVQPGWGTPGTGSGEFGLLPPSLIWENGTTLVLVRDCWSFSAWESVQVAMGVSLCTLPFCFATPRLLPSLSHSQMWLSFSSLPPLGAKSRCALMELAEGARLEVFSTEDYRTIRWEGLEELSNKIGMKFNEGLWP